MAAFSARRVSWEPIVAWRPIRTNPVGSIHIFFAIILLGFTFRILVDLQKRRLPKEVFVFVEVVGGSRTNLSARQIRARPDSLATDRNQEQQRFCSCVGLARHAERFFCARDKHYGHKQHLA